MRESGRRCVAATRDERVFRLIRVRRPTLGNSCPRLPNTAERTCCVHPAEARQPTLDKAPEPRRRVIYRMQSFGRRDRHAHLKSGRGPF